MQDTALRLVPNDEAHLKRLANQVLVQLPEDREQALRILGYVRWLVENFIHGDLPTEK